MDALIQLHDTCSSYLELPDATSKTDLLSLKSSHQAPWPGRLSFWGSTACRQRLDTNRNPPTGPHLVPAATSAAGRHGDQKGGALGKRPKTKTVWALCLMSGKLENDLLDEGKCQLKHLKPRIWQPMVSAQKPQISEYLQMVQGCTPSKRARPWRMLPCLQGSLRHPQTGLFLRSQIHQKARRTPPRPVSPIRAPRSAGVARPTKRRYTEHRGPGTRGATTPGGLAASLGISSAPSRPRTPTLRGAKHPSPSMCGLVWCVCVCSSGLEIVCSGGGRVEGSWCLAWSC